MFIKRYKPLNPSLRFRVNIDKKSLNIQKFKRLFYHKKNNSGRNNFGQISVRHKGGALFNSKRIVDFYRLLTLDGFFISYDVDKKYTCHLALVKYSNGIINYILAPHNLEKNQLIKTTFDTDLNKIGITKPLGWIKNGLNIFNLELNPKLGGTYIRSGGSFGKVLSKFKGKVLIRLPSKKKLYFSRYCLATIGRSSNTLNFLKVFGKAGISRKYNIRPSVRGETMNPIDHPNGGRTRGGKPRKNPWGKIIK